MNPVHGLQCLTLCLFVATILALMASYVEEKDHGFRQLFFFFVVCFVILGCVTP